MLNQTRTKVCRITVHKEGILTPPGPIPDKLMQHTPIPLNVNIKSEMRSFKSNENIHKKEGRSYYVVSANKASSVTL